MSWSLLLHMPLLFTYAKLLSSPKFCWMFWLSNFFWQLDCSGCLYTGCCEFGLCLWNHFIQHNVFCPAKSFKQRENADIWMERPPVLVNARGIRQTSLLSCLDNWDLGQQMEVVKAALRNGMSLQLKDLVLCHEAALLFSSLHGEGKPALREGWLHLRTEWGESPLGV